MNLNFSPLGEGVFADYPISQDLHKWRYFEELLYCNYSRLSLFAFTNTPYVRKSCMSKKSLISNGILCAEAA